MRVFSLKYILAIVISYLQPSLVADRALKYKRQFLYPYLDQDAVTESLTSTFIPLNAIVFQLVSCELIPSNTKLIIYFLEHIVRNRSR